MSTISLRLPDSLHDKIKEVAREDGISINQFLVTAAAEKLSAFLAEEYLEKRAARGSRAAFERALSNVPDTEPDEHDRL
jgi:uncharacterized protein (DUF1778 family)